MCPKCSENDKQYWQRGFKGLSDEPDAAEGYECGYCGHWYTEEQSDD